MDQALSDQDEIDAEVSDSLRRWAASTRERAAMTVERSRQLRADARILCDELARRRSALPRS